MHYAKFRCDEIVAQKDWGGSWWWFEYDDAGWIRRQVEQYDSGVSLRYSEERWEDLHGGLTDQALSLEDMPMPVLLTSSEFDAIWLDGRHQFP